jgi:hypothetical protein
MLFLHIFEANIVDQKIKKVHTDVLASIEQL